MSMRSRISEMDRTRQPGLEGIGLVLEKSEPGFIDFWCRFSTLISMRHETICSRCACIGGSEGIGLNLRTA
jgi:hypothetical protein